MNLLRKLVTGKGVWHSASDRSFSLGDRTHQHDNHCTEHRWRGTVVPSIVECSACGLACDWDRFQSKILGCACAKCSDLIGPHAEIDHSNGAAMRTLAAVYLAERR